MKHILVFITIVFLSYACECTDVEPTETPYRNTFFVQGISGSISPDPLSCEETLRINILFNKAVDNTTINFDDSVLLTGYQEGDLSFSTDGLTLTIIVDDFFCNDGSCDLALSMLSDAVKGVRSQTGDTLDGNRDGTSGDDFEIVMTLY